MNKFLVIAFVAMLCAAVATAGYPKVRYHTGGHKTHLGGAAYVYRPAKHVVHSYRKPVVYHHPAPIVYAHKSYSKPRTVHYVKPSYHHEVPHHAPVYHSKPVYYLGGHVSHGLAYKPVAYGHGGYSYHHKLH